MILSIDLFIALFGRLFSKIYLFANVFMHLFASHLYLKRYQKKKFCEYLYLFWNDLDWQYFPSQLVTLPKKSIKFLNLVGRIFEASLVSFLR